MDRCQGVPRPGESTIAYNNFIKYQQLDTIWYVT